METVKSIIHDCIIINQRQQSLRWATSRRLEAETVKSKAAAAHWYSEHLNLGWERRSKRKRKRNKKPLISAKLIHFQVLLQSESLLCRREVPSLRSRSLFDLKDEVFWSAHALQHTVVSLPLTQCMLGEDARWPEIKINELKMDFSMSSCWPCATSSSEFNFLTVEARPWWITSESWLTQV